jgi:hypothetical protein
MSAITSLTVRCNAPWSVDVESLGWMPLRTAVGLGRSVEVVVLINNPFNNRGTVVGIVIAPNMRTQPIAAVGVVAELVRIAEGGPRGLEPDLAGPRKEFLPDMVRRYARAIERSNPVMKVALPLTTVTGKTG